jgi:hypothetical protein
MCELHRRLALDRTTGLAAGDDTPPEQIVYRTQTILPPEAEDWAREEGLLGIGNWESNSKAKDLQAQLPYGQYPTANTLLIMTDPDPGAVYRLDPGLPRDAQRIEVGVRPGAGVSLVEVKLLVDGQTFAVLGGPPYRALWRLEPGRHAFSAVGIAADGQRLASDKVWIEVRQ